MSQLLLKDLESGLIHLFEILPEDQGYILWAAAERIREGLFPIYAYLHRTEDGNSSWKTLDGRYFDEGTEILVNEPTKEQVLAKLTPVERKVLGF